MAPTPLSRCLGLDAGGVVLEADLLLPPQPRGLVVIAHGSGSGRHSPRNRLVADRLRRCGLACLLVDWLTPAEATIGSSRGAPPPELEDLAGRMVALIDRLPQGAAGALANLNLGLFGASTGAAIALMAAAARPGRVRALVSRGGRPDLAQHQLAAVQSPTLLLVGGHDPLVLDLNRRAASQLGGPCRLLVIPTAGHLFEEAGCLDQVAAATATWFLDHLAHQRVEPSARHGQ